MPATPEPTPSDFHVYADLEVRWRDLDALGHVNNAVYFSYLESARVRYMAQVGTTSDPDPGKQFPFLLGEASCRFLATASLGQVLRVHIRASRVGNRSFEFEYLVSDRESGKPVATARTVQVCFDFAEGRTVSAPPWLRDRFEAIEGRPLFS
jgi:acyl-CoA thioester hydrolase